MRLTRRLRGLDRTAEAGNAPVVPDMAEEAVASDGSVGRGSEAGAEVSTEALASVEAASEEASEDWRARHDALRREFDAYRAEVEGRERAAQVRAAYRELLAQARIDPKRFDVILRATDLKGLKLGGDGRLEGAARLLQDIRAEWGDFVVTEGARGAAVASPPMNAGDAFERLSLAEKMAYANQHPGDAAVAAWLGERR